MLTLQRSKLPLLEISFLNVRGECIDTCNSMELWKIWKAIEQTHECVDVLGHCPQRLAESSRIRKHDV